MSPSASSPLTRLAELRRASVETLKLALPGHRLSERLRHVRPAGRLERALRRGGAAAPLRLLCGIQAPSPAPDAVRAGFDPAARARALESGGAAALAVATEPARAHGELAWVDAVRAACALPVLLDDIVVDAYQVLDAAARGADGIVLIAALCSDVQLQVLAGRARLLGLDPLVEVHDAVELRRALKAGSTLIGLGGREPGVDPAAIASELAPLVPPLVTAVAWGPLAIPDLAALRASRCDALLAGEDLLAAPDLAAALATLAAAARG